MATYFLFGKYSPDALKSITAQRTKGAVELVKKCGGEVKGIYATLGDSDLIFITEFPTVEQALKSSLALTRTTGIGFKTSPAMSVEEFDKIASEV